VTGKFEGRTAREWIAALRDPDPRARAGAARALARLCAAAVDAPFDEVLDALKPRLELGRGLEPDRRARDAMFEATKVVAERRARVLGLRVKRPADLRTMRGGDLVRHAIDRLWDACDIYSDRAALRSVLDLATPGQIAVYAIFWTHAEVSNGGFHQYFHNATGILAPEALDGLRRIGALRFAELLERAMRRFPRGAPPTDNARRRDDLDSITDGAFRGLDEAFFELDRHDDLLELVADHVRAHPDEFFEAERRG